MGIKKLLSKVNMPAKASMAYLGASILGKAFGIITTPFFTRLISREDYGELTLYMTILGGASVVCSAVSSGSAVYRGFKIYENKRGGFIKSALAVSLGFSAVVCLLLFALSPFLGLKRVLFIPLSLQIICDCVVGFSLARARYLYKYGEVMTINLLSAALPSLVSLFLLGRFDGGFGVRIYSMLALSIVIALWQLIRLLRLSGQAERGIVGEVVKSSLPLLPHSLSVAISGQIDKLFITSIMGSAALASYSVAHSLGISMQFIVTALGSSLGPWLVRRLDENNTDKIGAVVSSIFSILSAISIGLCAISPELMIILAPRAYLDALPAIAPIALSVPLGFLSYVVTVGLVQLGRGRYTAVVSLLSLILCIIFNYTLIPSLGYLGAGLSLLLSCGVGAAVGVWLLLRFGYEKILPIKRLCVVFFSGVGIWLLTVPFYNSLFVRVLILILPSIMMLNSLLRSRQLITE